MLRFFKKYYPIRNALFVLSEGLVIFLFLSVIMASRLLLLNDNSLFHYDILFKALLITAICLACLDYKGLYDLKATDTLVELGIRLLQALGASAILMALIYFAFPVCIISQGIFIASGAIVMIFIVSWRIGYTKILNLGLFNQKIIVLGSNAIATEICAQIIDKRDCGYEIAHVISDHQWNDQSLKKPISIIHQDSYENLYEIAEEAGVKKIVVALNEKRGGLPIKELLRCRVKGVEVLEGNRFYEMLTGKLIPESINPGWLIFSKGFRKSPLQKLFKRTADLILSLTMLIFLSPLIVLVAAIIKLDSKGPVFFSQERIGENRKPYMVYKFRSMVSDAEACAGPIWAQDNDCRITRVGHFLRKWSVDEIPQLWNVLKGEMSFVGPRPERNHFIKELEEIIPYYGERFSAKPGLTGWAQVSYGYGESVEDAVEKLNYDLFYIKNMSIIMDILIFMSSIKKLLFTKQAADWFIETEGSADNYKKESTLSYDSKNDTEDAFAVARIIDHKNNEPIIVGQKYIIEAGIQKVIPIGFKGTPFFIEKLQETVDFDIILHAENMEIKPHWVQPYTYNKNDTSSHFIKFYIKPLEIGLKKIQVEFIHKSHWLTMIQFNLQVIEHAVFKAII